MLSMHDNEQYLFEALKAGASGYVLKTAADRDLVEACRAALRGEPFLYPSAIAALVRDFLDRAREGDATPEDPLTPRELQVLKLVAEAHTNDADRRRAGDQPQDRRAPSREPHGQARHARPGRADPVRDQARPGRALAKWGGGPTASPVERGVPDRGWDAKPMVRAPAAAHDARVSRLLVVWSRPHHLTAEEASQWVRAEIGALLGDAGTRSAELRRLERASPRHGCDWHWLLDLDVAAPASEFVERAPARNGSGISGCSGCARRSMVAGDAVAREGKGV